MSEKLRPVRIERSQEKIPNFGPLIACIGRLEDFSREDLNEQRALDPVQVDYYGSKEKWGRLEQKNNGHNTYVISRVDSENKESDEYADCTGMAVVGKHKERGVNVSILTHTDPKRFSVPETLGEEVSQYEKDLKERLQQIKDLSEPGTLDVLLFGGFTGERRDDERYANLIELTGKISQDVLGIDPVVVVGPGYPNPQLGEPYTVRALLDTQLRRLHIIRPNQHEVAKDSNITFHASEVHEKQAEWKGDHRYI